MANKLNRRDFIKISGAGAGALAVGGKFYSSYASDKSTFYPSDINKEGKIEKTPTYCEICFWKCAGWTYTVDGEPWKVVGNDIDPHCYGRFCPRGTGGIGAYYDSDRLKTPLIRTEKRGKQVFREATWEEAFDYIAEKMKEIEKEHGPECIALFTHGSGGSYFKNLLRAFGSNNVAAPSYAQCRGPREEAYVITYGEGIGSPERTDLENAKCIVLIGSHLGENMHNGQVQEFTEAIANGASVIT
ncbi:MAG: molybdopterin-dependent oxidoreductase, partial [Calditrichia bacterium]|nr:molybdopterin-dependent oxidoreductase [Calditrichia bacterium]